MADGSGPFVAIVGGFWQFKDDPVVFDEAKRIAAEIGAALAAVGMGLVVYFSNDESLEPHVVAGYLRALPAGEGAGSIRVRYAQSQKSAVRFKEQTARKDVFELKLFPSEDWEAPFYRSLAAAEGVDAVLLMAGARSTLIAGQIAVARQLPVLAVDKFDGAAATIRTELTIGAPDYPSADTHSVIEMVSWLKKQCDARAKLRAEALVKQAQYLESISQQKRAFVAVAAFVALLVTFYYALGLPPEPKFYGVLTLAGLIAAGATGALIRSVIWGAEGVTPWTSLLLGAVAGFVAGLAYLVPQYVGKYGVLDPTATKVEATDKIQFISAVLVGISAGVGFDSIFTRLKKRADDQAISPPAQK
jgi:hypothetical protein